MKKALLLGATGLIGSHLLHELLSSPDYSQVTVVVRRPLENTNPKLKMLIGDFTSIVGLNSELQADDMFLTLGTTKAHTPRQDDYYQIDHDYPVLAAKLAKASGATSVFFVTAIGANSGSSFFYVRMKGDIERDIIALDFEHTHIFEPSMITGQRKEHRALESTIIAIWKFVDNLLVGKLNQYRGIDGKSVAKAMLRAAQKPSEKIKIYRWREMVDLIR